MPELPLTALIKHWVGSPSEFPLENRIFNSFCLVALVAIAYHIPLNFLLNLPVSTAISVFLLFIQFGMYYLSRFKNRVHLSILISGIVIHALFIVNYFFNSGITGPTLVLLILSFFLILAVAPPKQYAGWLAGNLVIVLSLLYIEYIKPDLVPNGYLQRNDKFFDIGSAYIVTIILVYTGIVFIRRNYDKERRSAEEKAMALERLNGEKTKLFSIISHDLRAPLANIQNYLEFLSFTDLTLEEKQLLQQDLLRATQSTQEMLTNLLSWSKSQLDGIKPRLHHLNLTETLKPTLELLRILAKKKGLELTWQIADECSVAADANMLQLIIRNLVNNAIKFTAAGHIKIASRLRGNECIISITDTGSGIAPERRKDLFQFSTQSTYGTQKEKGVGLGLVLCREYTDAQNGKIWFESIVGKGTTFYISLSASVKTGADQNY
ncbi:MAG TPA: HAMP domain-containing sensor histidine kinase [Sphingobacteriaceae bacterium]